jgi:hypothetical protein
MAAWKEADMNGQALAGMGDALLSKGEWARASQVYALALARGGLRREADVRLHQGLALHQGGQAGAAREMWASVSGDAAAVELASLWMLMARGGVK